MKGNHITKFLGIVVVSLLFSQTSYALDDYQNEIYLGCVESSQHLTSSRAKQYCRCISLMVTQKHTIEELESASKLGQQGIANMFRSSVNYCNTNAKAIGD